MYLKFFSSSFTSTWPALHNLWNVYQRVLSVAIWFKVNRVFRDRCCCRKVKEINIFYYYYSPKNSTRKIAVGNITFLTSVQLHGLSPLCNFLLAFIHMFVWITAFALLVLVKLHYSGGMLFLSTCRMHDREAKGKANIRTSYSVLLVSYHLRFRDKIKILNTTLETSC